MTRRVKPQFPPGWDLASCRRCGYGTEDASRHGGVCSGCPWKGMSVDRAGMTPANRAYARAYAKAAATLERRRWQEGGSFDRKLQARMYREEGWSYRAIAKSLHVNESTIRRDIKEGLPAEFVHPSLAAPIKGVTVIGRTGIEYPPRPKPISK